MKALDFDDEYDIRSAYKVLDELKVERITLGNFHTLYLGLGFEPKHLSLEDLKAVVLDALARHRTDASIVYRNNSDWNSIPLDVVLDVLKDYSRNRSKQIDRCYDLLDIDSKDFLSSQDVVRLSRDVGEPISSQEAEMMLINGEMKKKDFSELMSSRQK